MMKSMRKNMKVILWVVVFAFIGTIFFVWGMGAGKNRDYMHQQAAAVVNDDLISYSDFERVWDNESRPLFAQSGEEPSRQELQHLRTSLVDELIDRLLLRQAYAKLGLGIFPEEVASRIASIPGFSADGKFSQQRYLDLLSYNRISPDDFEREQAQDLQVLKMERLLETTALFSEDDLRHYFRQRSRKVKLALVGFDWTTLTAGITVTPEAAKDYFEQHRKDYDQPLEVRASHILLRVDPKAAPEQKQEVRAKLSGIREEILKGKDFAAAARQYSQDPGSADKGGDLGFFASGQMVPAFEKATFGLKVGELSAPVETAFGYHLIKVTDRHEEKRVAFEDVRDQVTKHIRETGARKQAAAQALRFATAVKTANHVAAAAAAVNLPVVTTGWVKLGSALPGVLKPEAVLDGALDLSPKVASDAITAGDAKVFVEVLDETFTAWDERAFTREHDALAEKFKLQRSAQMLSDWLKQSRAEGKIANNLAQEKAE